MQEPELDETKTVLENVQEGVGPIKAKLDRFNEISLAMAEPDADFDSLLAEMGVLQEEIDAADAWDLDSQLEQAMDALRTPPGDASVANLSGGEKRRVALTKLLLAKPDLLLLDEPTNHLDAESVLWLEQHLKQYAGAVIAVTHDRYFLDNVAEWIAEVDRGHLYPYEGNYSTYLEKKAQRLDVQGKKDQKLAKRLADELEWVRSNAKGRQAKSKARLARYEEMASEADRTRKLDFEEIQIPPGPRLGNVVVEAKKLEKGFDGRDLIEGLSFTLPPNGIVGVIGPNGVGKTTLIKTIVGLEQLDGGELKVGETVKISYVDQNRGGIDPNKNLWEVVSDGLDIITVGKVEIPSRAYVSKFGFKGPDQQKKAGVLSGGERNRLNLALTLKQGGNLLLLDEPTNDLDVETLVEPRERAARVPRLRRGDHPRSLVPRPDRDPHPRLRGHRGRARQVVLVRGQLRRLRGEQDRAARPGGGGAAPQRLPQAHPQLTDDPPARPDHAALERPRRLRPRQQRRDAPPLRGGAHHGVLAVRRRARQRSEPTAGSTAVLDGRPGADTITLIARQEVEYLAPIPYLRAAARHPALARPHRRASLEVCYEVCSPVGSRADDAVRHARQRRSCSSTPRPRRRDASPTASGRRGRRTSTPRSSSAGHELAAPARSPTR